MAYAGDQGLLETHRKRVYSFTRTNYIKKEFDTENLAEKGPGRSFWIILNQTFIDSRKERLNILEYIGYNEKPKEKKPIALVKK